MGTYNYALAGIYEGGGVTLTIIPQSATDLQLELTGVSGTTVAVSFTDTDNMLMYPNNGSAQVTLSGVNWTQWAYNANFTIHVNGKPVVVGLTKTESPDQGIQISYSNCPVLKAFRVPVSGSFQLNFMSTVTVHCRSVASNNYDYAITFDEGSQDAMLYDFSFNNQEFEVEGGYLQMGTPEPPISCGCPSSGEMPFFDLLQVTS